MQYCALEAENGSYISFLMHANETSQCKLTAFQTAWTNLLHGGDIVEVHHLIESEGTGTHQCLFEYSQN